MARSGVPEIPTRSGADEGPRAPTDMGTGQARLGRGILPRRGEWPRPRRPPTAGHAGELRLRPAWRGANLAIPAGKDWEAGNDDAQKS